MKKIFIDVGYHIGRAVSIFKETKEYSSDFIIYAFEPRIDLEKAQQKTKEENIAFLKTAAWIYDGEIKFYISSRNKGQPSGIFDTFRGKNKESFMSPCIDFSKWIIDNFNKDDFIVLKMDIEGTEQDVLNKMIEDGSINYIDIAYVEWHNKKREGYKEFKTALKNISSLDLRTAIEWYKE